MHVDEVELELTGVRENRRFHLIDDDGRLVNGKFAGTLVQVAATTDRDGTLLALRFPDGSTVDGPVELGEPVETNFYGRPVAGRIVARRALATRCRRSPGGPLRLVRVDEPGAGSDRGVEGTVSVVSRGSLEDDRARGGRGAASTAAASGCCSRSTGSRRTARTAGPGAASRSATPSSGCTGSSAAAP